MSRSRLARLPRAATLEDLLHRAGRDVGELGDASAGYPGGRGLEDQHVALFGRLVGLGPRGVPSLRRGREAPFECGRAGRVRFAWRHSFSYYTH